MILCRPGPAALSWQRLAVCMPLTTTTRVLLTGAGAQLAGAIRHRFDGHCILTAVTRQECDVASTTDVARVCGDAGPQVIINCASFNDVDGAERDPEGALRANGLALAVLADAATRARAVLLHYSTDFVFDPAVDPGPLREDAPVSPRSIYAQSKLLGEILAKRAPKHYVLRVASLFGGSRAKSSLDRLAAAIRRGDTVKAFANRTVTPSYVPDLAAAAAAVLDGDVPYGLYHCVNSDHGTWVDVARAIAVESGIDPDRAVTPVPFDPTAFPARRPTYAALSNAALASHGVTMPTWRDAVARYVRALSAA
jgi:dTDP-4-dehydrorhamnose reductase